MKADLFLHSLFPIFTASFVPTLLSRRYHTIVSEVREVEVVTPEEDPNADPNQQSRSGILYSDVIDGLYQLYPPFDLEKRTAASRTDGYWPYVQQGLDPPKETTYGEYDLYFFAQLLDKALEYCDAGDNFNDIVFCDIGSGTGRLVLAAAALHPGFRQCRGIELLNSIHIVAEKTLERCNINYAEEEIVPSLLSSSLVGESDWLNQFKGQFIFGATEAGEDNENELDESDIEEHLSETDEEPEPLYRLPSKTNQSLHFAPIAFVCGSFEDPSVYFGDANVIFCFSSCMSESIIARLSKAIGQQCKPGTIVITTEFPLQLEGVIDPLYVPDEDKYSHCTYDGDFDDPDDEEEWIRFCEEEGIQMKPFQFELLESLDGYCWITGGQSTAHIHRVVTSVGADGPTRYDDEMEEQAAMAWIYAQRKNPDDFYRDVRNSMVFHGFSPTWYAGLVDEE